MLLLEPRPIKKSKERSAAGHVRLLSMDRRSQALTRWLFFPLLAGASVLLSGCGFEAPAPGRSPAPATPPVPVSTLSATLTVPLGSAGPSVGQHDPIPDRGCEEPADQMRPVAVPSRPARDPHRRACGYAGERRLGYPHAVCGEGGALHLRLFVSARAGRGPGAGRGTNRA